MSEAKCRKCGETCVAITLEAFACDNCGDEYREVREPIYSQLETELAEARAEIARLKKQNLDRASATLWAIMRHAFMDGAFKGYQHGTEERLRIQYFNEWCQKNYPEAVDEAIAQMRLIEQMCEALKLADDLIDEYAADYEHRDNVDEIREEIKAALAAERGE